MLSSDIAPKCRLIMLPPRDMTVEQVRLILLEVAKALETPEAASRLIQAKIMAGQDVITKLKVVYPIIRQIEINIIGTHGYDNSTEGLVQFAERVRDTEKLDPEIARLHVLIRDHYLAVDSSSMVDMLTNA